MGVTGWTGLGRWTGLDKDAVVWRNRWTGLGKMCEVWRKMRWFGEGGLRPHIERQITALLGIHCIALHCRVVRDTRAAGEVV